MSLALWIVSGLLTLVFLMAGAMKLVRSRAELSDTMNWVDDFSDGQVKLIGALEVAGAIGVTAPFATGIAPFLTPFAAVGLVLTMLGAAVVHAKRGETSFVVVNVVLLAMAGFVAYGRYMGAV